MTDPSLISMLRDRRWAAGLSQSELAERAGVSRQAISAIEAGRQVPSTMLALQLARALHCAVDELFRLAGGPVVSVRLARRTDVGERVVIGRVDGELFAHPIAAPGRAADGVVVAADSTGWGHVELVAEANEIENNVLVAGCAPLLGAICDRVGRRFRDVRASWIPADSMTALELLSAGAVHIAGVHLASAGDPSPHEEAARRAAPHQPVSLVNLARWQQGLVVAPDNPLSIGVGNELLRPDLRWVVRDAGAGAQHLLERLVRAAGGEAPCSEVPVAADHQDVARLVRWGVADVGVAIESAALAHGLGFVPVAEERFDLIVPGTRLDLPIVARFLDQLAGRPFRSECGAMPGYDLSHAGEVATVSVG